MECTICLPQYQTPFRSSELSGVSEGLIAICFSSFKDVSSLEFMSLQGLQGSNTLDADWEEQQAPSTPVMQLSTGLSRRKALGIDMNVSAEKTARATLFTVPAHTSPNIYIFKLSLRGKLLQTLSCSDNWELC